MMLLVSWVVVVVVIVVVAAEDEIQCLMMTNFPGSSDVVVAPSSLIA